MYVAKLELLFFEFAFFSYIHNRFRSNSSGEKVGYTNWASAQPDNNGTDGEHCVIENNDGSWSDVECEAVEAVAVCAEDPVASDCNADLPAGDPDWGDWYD